MSEQPRATAIALCALLLPATASGGALGSPPAVPLTLTVVARATDVACPIWEITALDVRHDGHVLLACNDALQEIVPGAPHATDVAWTPLALAPGDQGTHVEILRELPGGDELVVRVELELNGIGTWIYRRSLSTPPATLVGARSPASTSSPVASDRLIASLPGFVARDATVVPSGHIYLAGAGYRVTLATGMMVGIAPLFDRIVELRDDGRVTDVAGRAPPSGTIAPGVRCRDGSTDRATFGRLVGMVGRSDGSLVVLDQDCLSLRRVVPDTATVSTLWPAAGAIRDPLTLPQQLAGAPGTRALLIQDDDGLRLFPFDGMLHKVAIGARADTGPIAPIAPRAHPILVAGPDGDFYAVTPQAIVRLWAATG